MRPRTPFGLSVLTVVILLLTALSGLIVAAGPSADGKAKKSSKVRRLPAEVDLRPQFMEYGLGPRRQGSRGTCSVFTTAAALEFALAKQMRQGVPLSVEYLNWASNRAINDNSDGGFFHDLLKGFEQYGICLEGQMPYQEQFNPNLAPSAQATATASELLGKPFEIHWINPWKPMPGLTDEQLREIKVVLAAGWPVAAGSSHSRLLVGYVDDLDQPGGGSFITKDSGSAQFDRISYEFTKEKIGDAFWIESPLKRKAKKPKS
jgi:C1A family cysteine protease